MKQTWKKALIVLSVLFLIAGVTACGKGKDKDKNKGGSDSNAAVGDVSYPLDTDVSLSYWCANQIALAEDINNYQASPFHSGLETKTGVPIEWRWSAAGSDVGQTYQLLWVDTELPNMVFFRISSNEAAVLLEDGLIYDLTEYLPKYAPNYWKWINDPANEAERKEATLSDGTFYSVASVKEDIYNQLYMGPIVRQDWLDECGLQTPVTLADWENVLRTFKQKYGATLSFTSSIMTASGGIASGTGAYGFANTTDFRVDDEGNVVIPQITKEWKEMMEILVKWYKEGLIDIDALSNSDDSLRQKALSGKAGIAFVMAGQANMIMNDSAQAGTGAKWVGMEYPRTAPDAPTSMVCANATKLTGYHTVITTQTSEDELITALRWLDYGWTEEGRMYWNFGDEGISYELDKDGVPQWTDLVLKDELGMSNGRNKYCGVSGSASVIQMKSWAKASNSEAMDATIEAWARNTEANKHILPSSEFTLEDNEKYNSLWAPISTFINEESLKILTGESSISSIDNFTKKLYDIGLQDVLDLKQKYYDDEYQ